MTRHASRAGAPASRRTWALAAATSLFASTWTFGGAPEARAEEGAFQHVACSLAVASGIADTGLCAQPVVLDRAPAAPTPAPTPGPVSGPAPSAPVPPAPAPAAPPARGIDPAYVPQADVAVPPGGLTQALLDRSPERTSFALLAGVHRLTEPLRLRTGQQLLGQPGASLNGSKVLTGWTASGGAWFVDGQTQRLPRVTAPGYDVCLPGSAMCNNSEAVFVNGAPVREVATRAEVRPGTFWFDQAASRIWLGGDPAGRTVETTVATGALRDGRDNVVRNLVVERFGNALQSAAVHGVGMVLERSVIRHNSGQGASIYGGRVSSSLILSNGQLGLAGGGQGLVVEGNEIAFNNTEGVNPSWEAGGTKWAFSVDLVVRGNWSHHNWGSGFTTDVNNLRSLYEGNTVEDNGDIGIMHEISYAAVIRNNVVRRNGQRDGWFPSRVGINITNSSDVEVTGNIIEDNLGGGVLGTQDNRVGGGDHGAWELRNLNVHRNVIRATGPGSHFSWQNGLDVHHTVADRARFFTSYANRFTSNTFHLPSPAGLWFITNAPDGAGSTSVDWQTWRRTQDDGSAALPG